MNLEGVGGHGSPGTPIGVPLWRPWVPGPGVFRGEVRDKKERG